MKSENNEFKRWFRNLSDRRKDQLIERSGVALQFEDGSVCLVSPLEDGSLDFTTFGTPQQMINGMAEEFGKNLKSMRVGVNLDW